MTAFFCELQKSRRRWDGLVVTGIALLVLVWSSGSMPTTKDEKATFYSALFYVLPLLHTVVMPLGMAALASRLWDAETKGCTAKLLYTLQSRASLFAAKTALGLLELGLVVVLELSGLLLMGRFAGVSEPLDAGQLLWVAVSTLAVNSMLFLAASCLCIHSGQTMPVWELDLGAVYADCLRRICLPDLPTLSRSPIFFR